MIDFQIASSSVEFALAAASALAYLDPGTGSFALQIFLATLFGGLFALRQSWSGVKIWFASTLRARRGRDLEGNARPTIHGQPTAEIR